MFSILYDESDFRLDHDILLLQVFSILYDESDLRFDREDLVLEQFSILYDESNLRFDQISLSFLFGSNGWTKRNEPFLTLRNTIHMIHILRCLFLIVKRQIRYPCTVSSWFVLPLWRYLIDTSKNCIVNTLH